MPFVLRPGGCLHLLTILVSAQRMCKVVGVETPLGGERLCKRVAKESILRNY